ncbi:hypothetical protein VE25_04960 [Devosia geojensis]|uniref:Uncharacterized protein n=2 Tax=Devosia geojensis TaxID=443610 RepID=A0A0F5FVP7_9HYPH|nr:hypothetical protein VE25_04960 [Devosia geojensis]
MEALRAHIGRRVRTLTTARHSGFDGVALTLTDPVELPADTQGFIANPWQDYVLIALPNNPGHFPNLDKLMRSGQFHLIAAKSTDFTRQFEIDI